MRSGTFLLVAAIAALPIADAHAQASARGWQSHRSTDPMDGAIRVSLSRPADLAIRDSLGRSATPILFLRCNRSAGESEGKVEVYLRFPNALFIPPQSPPRFRLDDGDVGDIRWTSSADERSMFWREPNLFALSEASTLHIDLVPPLSGRQYTRFSLPDASGAALGIMRECGFPQSVESVADPAGFGWVARQSLRQGLSGQLEIHETSEPRETTMAQWDAERPSITAPAPSGYRGPLFSPAFHEEVQDTTYEVCVEFSYEGRPSAAFYLIAEGRVRYSRSSHQVDTCDVPPSPSH